MNWLRGALAILVKDVRSEVRARAALNAIVLFAVMTLVMVSFAIGGFGLTPEVHASLLWIIMFFASMAGLSRTFVVEEERGTVMALRLTAAGGQVYFGKFLFNLALLIMLCVILLPLFQVFLPIPRANWSLLLGSLVLGCLALAATSTLVAAIVSQAGVKGALFTVIAFPILAPALLAGVAATQKAMAEQPMSAAMTELQLLVSYSGVMLVGSFYLFDFVWRD